ncbi:carboxymuconolactone decarboxylase family protein [Methanococcus maripaludis]|uniref:Alkylhydroperoxidase/carboxymuconolactone decarboxylase family protein YurZ n=2 Tax=Methanococcus maripaludis TaxID=39152 RepID=A0A7J9PG21_METMI|nr:carboxymuconolactone decarboxylase family protein [Methanococcus maripaludis]MBA2862182.1 alkylhydroperoxidase/carboxymuconolactone decarboxylase family protein YurZ [Methanococcus maripaludis]
MKEGVFFGEGMKFVKEGYPDIYDAVVGLNKAAFTGKTLDYKTQKLIAIGIVAATGDENAAEKQMRSGMVELKITKEEIIDALRVVLLTSGMPAFTKAMKVVSKL